MRVGGDAVFLLVDVVGKGDLHVFLRMRRLGRDAEPRVWTPAVEDGTRASILAYTTSCLVFHELLQRAECDALESVGVQVLSFSDHVLAQRIALREGEPLHEFTLSCEVRASLSRKPKKARDVLLPFGLELSSELLEAATHPAGTAATSEEKNDAGDSSPSAPSEKYIECDARSSETASHSDAGEGPAVAPGVVVPAVAYKPNRLERTGLFKYDMAPSGVSKCLICGDRIAKNEFRWMTQVRLSLKLADSRYLHMACLGSLPLANRDTDLRCVRFFMRELEDHTLATGVAQEGVSAFLEDSERILQGPSAGSSADAA